MHESNTQVAQKAIKASLNGDWDLTIKLNTDILDKNPNNIHAKIRLGRAYLMTKEFSKAKKLFLSVLKQDPINVIAKKNLEIAKRKRVDTPVVAANTKSLLKTPGTTTQTNVKITNNKIKCEQFTPGEELGLRISKDEITLLKDNTTKIGHIEDTDIIKKLRNAKLTKTNLKVTLAKCKDDSVCAIIIKASAHIFKAEKLDIRPYLKKGTIEEPILEIQN